jgi:hypothetical protein
MRETCLCAVLATTLVACTTFGSAPEDDMSKNDAPAPQKSAAPSEPSQAAAPKPAPAVSCLQILARDPSRFAADGLYEIDPDGPGGNASIQVFCDMTLDGGGWTLVARSVRGAPEQPFGWSVDTGSVTDARTPYSLDVVAAKLALTEILVADYDGDDPTIHTHAYAFLVANGFLSHASDTAQNGDVRSVLGDCDPGGSGPSMLRHAGNTSLTDDFFFRDIPESGQHRGLHPNGFDLAYTDCAHSGSLDGEQGIVLVR